MALQPYTIIEQSMVSPPVGSVPSTTLPVSVYDLATSHSLLVQWLSFYEFPHSVEYFEETVVPCLKNSLSLALQLFFPLAGNFMCPPPPTKPYILYNDGDSVQFTVAVADSTANFEHLVMDNYPRDLEDLLHFVPNKLPPIHVKGDDILVFPLMALQVTIFPNLAFSVGVTFNHVVADGSAVSHFLKTWALICKNGEEYVKCLQDENLLPLHDRSLFDNIPNLMEIEPSILMAFRNWESKQKEEDKDPSHDSQVHQKSLVTFIMDGAQIERLKHWVENQSRNNSDSVHLSTFVVTSALIWVCIVKSEMIGANKFLDDKDQQWNLVFPANTRSRLENPIPNTYFGNCLVPCVASIKKRDLLGANGIVAAAKAIGNKVQELQIYKDLPLEKDYQDLMEAIPNQGVSTGTSSLKFGFYEIDFGWGRPKKLDFVHTNPSSPLTESILSDTKYDKCGIQASLFGIRAKLDNFKALFEESLKMIDSAHEEAVEEIKDTTQAVDPNSGYNN
ncbi:hypothetical protein UlMin_033331 [Ulmus minor]